MMLAVIYIKILGSRYVFTIITLLHYRGDFSHCHSYAFLSYEQIGAKRKKVQKQKHSV